jgi:hypothetical protein
VTAVDEARLDGNAIGGLLLELFAAEMTVATGVCASCGAASLVAELHVYVRAPGVVARCPACETVVLCIVQAPGRTWLNLGGLRTLEIRT